MKWRDWVNRDLEAVGLREEDGIDRGGEVEDCATPTTLLNGITACRTT